MKRKAFYILAVLGLLVASCAPAAPTQAPATVAPATVAPATEAPTEAATTEPTQPACDHTLKIAIIGSMSGTTASLGEYMTNGVTLAVEQKNAEGGIQGCQIELVKYDDEADPTKSTGVAQKVATEALAGGTNALSLASGDPRRIRDEVRRAIDILGPTNRFILQPVDAIFPDTPWPGVEAMIEAWRELQ